MKFFPSFREQLATALADHGLSLVKCELGRAADNAPIWTVTFQDPARGAMSLIASSPTGTPPYANSTARRVAARIVAYLRDTNALRDQQQASTPCGD